MRFDNTNLPSALFTICVYILLMIPIGIVLGIISGGIIIGKSIDFIFKIDEEEQGGKKW